RSSSASSLKTASISSPVTSGMSESTVHSVSTPCPASAEVARRTAALSPRGNSSSITSAPAVRARLSSPGSELMTATCSAARALSAAARTSRNIASASAIRSASPSARPRRVLAKARCLAAMRIARTAYLYNSRRLRSQPQKNRSLKQYNTEKLKERGIRLDSLRVAAPTLNLRSAIICRAAALRAAPLRADAIVAADAPHLLSPARQVEEMERKQRIFSELGQSKLNRA